MGIKPGPKRIAKTTGKPDKRQRDNKKTPGNTPSLKPHKHKKGDQIVIAQLCKLVLNQGKVKWIAPPLIDVCRPVYSSKLGLGTKFWTSIQGVGRRG